MPSITALQEALEAKLGSLGLRVVEPVADHRVRNTTVSLGVYRFTTLEQGIKRSVELVSLAQDIVVRAPAKKYRDIAQTLDILRSIPPIPDTQYAGVSEGDIEVDGDTLRGVITINLEFYWTA